MKVWGDTVLLALRLREAGSHFPGPGSGFRFRVPVSGRGCGLSGRAGLGGGVGGRFRATGDENSNDHD